MTRIATTLMAVAMFWTEALSRVPRTLMTAIMTMSPTATRLLATGDKGMNWVR